MESSKLSIRDEFIVRSALGIGTPPLSLEEIARKLKLTEEEVSAIVTSAWKRAISDVVGELRIKMAFERARVLRGEPDFGPGTGSWS